MSALPGGFGLGLRTEHYRDFIDFGDHRPAVDGVEVLSENYMVPGGKSLRVLDAIRRDHPVVMHGVSMSIGSTEAFDLNYLRSLKALAQRIEPAWVSDHLCWVGVYHHNLHDLLGRRLLLENVSSCVSFQADEMSEWAFIVQLAKRAD